MYYDIGIYHTTLIVKFQVQLYAYVVVEHTWAFADTIIEANISHLENVSL